MGREWIPDNLKVYSVVEGKIEGYNSVILGTDKGTGRRYTIPSFSKTRGSNGIRISGSFDVEGMEVLVVDDLVESGDTRVSVCEKVSEMGAGRVEGLAAHGVLRKGVERLRKVFDNFILSNSIKGVGGEVGVEKYVRRFSEMI